MAYTGPFNIYAAATSQSPLDGAYQMIGNANPSCADFLGPYSFGGNLYMLIQTVGSAVEPSLVYAVKSTDSGATWSILDSANSPVRSSGAVEGATTAGCFRDGTSIWVCYSPNNGGAFTGAPMRMKAFDLNTETWGAATANGPGAVVIDCLFKRAGDGTFIVVHNNNSTTSTLMYSIYDPGSDTWSGPNDATTNWAGLTSNNAAACVLDSSDVLHMICPARTAGTVDRYLYQQVSAANAVQNFAMISPTLYGPLGSTNAFCAKPVIVGTQILFGVADATLTLPVCLIGTGISGAPTWSVSSTMDPTYDLFRLTPFALSYDPIDNIVYGTATDANAGFTGGEVRLVACLTSDLVNGWGLLQSFDVTVDNSGFSYQFATPFPSGVTGTPPYILYQANPPDTTGGFSSIQTGYMLVPGSTPPVTPTPIRLSIYGWRVYRGRPICETQLFDLPADMTPPQWRPEDDQDSTTPPPPKRVL